MKSQSHRIINALKSVECANDVFEALNYVPSENLNDMKEMINYILLHREETGCQQQKNA